MLFVPEGGRLVSAQPFVPRSKPFGSGSKWSRRHPLGIPPKRPPSCDHEACPRVASTLNSTKDYEFNLEGLPNVKFTTGIVIAMKKSIPRSMSEAASARTILFVFFRLIRRACRSSPRMDETCIPPISLAPPSSELLAESQTPMRGSITDAAVYRVLDIDSAQYRNSPSLQHLGFMARLESCCFRG